MIEKDKKIEAETVDERVIDLETIGLKLKMALLEKEKNDEYWFRVPGAKFKIRNIPEIEEIADDTGFCTTEEIQRLCQGTKKILAETVWSWVKIDGWGIQLQLGIDETNDNTQSNNVSAIQEITKHLVKIIKKDLGIDVSKDQIGLRILKAAAEKANQNLVSADETTINLRFDLLKIPLKIKNPWASSRFETKLTRSKVNDLLLAANNLLFAAKIMKPIELNQENKEVEFHIEASDETDKIQNIVKVNVEEILSQIEQLQTETSEAEEAINSNDIYEALKIAEKHKDYPHSRDLALKAARKNPEKTINLLYIYIDLPWAKDVLETAAFIVPETALKHLDEYISKPWAKDILTITARLIPEATIGRYHEYKSQPWAKDIVEIIAKEAPEIAIEKFYIYSSKGPWSDEILGIIAENNVRVALKNFGEYGNRPKALAILKKTAKENRLNIRFLLHRISYVLVGN